MRETILPGFCCYPLVSSLFAGRILLVLMGVLLAFATHADDAQDVKYVSNFAEKGLAGWKHRRFAGSTKYRIVELDGSKVLRAHTRSSASTIYRRIKVDLEKYPILNWSWRISNVYNVTNPGSKDGDDYAARIYVVASTDGGGQKVLNYVWANHVWANHVWANADSEDIWLNPFSSDSVMIGTASNNETVGRWKAEQVNVRQDFMRVFNIDVSEIDMIAIMSDSDNSGGEATAWFGEIFFSTE